MFGSKLYYQNSCHGIRMLYTKYLNRIKLSSRFDFKTLTWFNFPGICDVVQS